MEQPHHGHVGYLDSLRSLVDGLLASAKDRLELLAVELQEEKLRLVQTFVWISAAVFTGILAVTFLSLTLVIIFWENARLEVLAGLSVLYLAATSAITLGFRRFLARQPAPFAATRQELEADRACILGKN